MDKEFRRSITTTLVILMAVVMILAAFSMGYILTERAGRAMKKIMSDYMLSVSDTAAAMLDGDELKAFSPDSEGTPEYEDVTKTLLYFAENINLEYIYCIDCNGEDDFTFILDPMADDPGKFGEQVEATDALRKAARGESAVDQQPYSDRWGTFYSAYSPVFDSNGDVAGIVAVDFDAGWYDKQINMISTTAFYIGLMSLIMGAIVIVLITAGNRKSLKRAHDQLNELADNVEELVGEIDSRTADELKKNEPKKVKMVYEDDGIDALGEKISNMQEVLHEQIARIRDNAYIDALTGAKNRNAYLEDIAEIEPGIEDGSAEFALAVFDIISLKQINDTFGHEGGDKAISDAARALTEVFGRDNLYRVGGDEFVAGLRFADEEDMKKCFVKLEGILEKKNREGGQYADMPLGISRGCAAFDPEEDKEFMDVFRRADLRMYEDKAAWYKEHGDRRSGTN